MSRRYGLTFYYFENHLSRAKAKGSSQPHVNQVGELRLSDTGTVIGTEDGSVAACGSSIEASATKA